MLTILKYPDPILTKPAEPILEINDEIRQLAKEMIETMYGSHGVGLAGPQVGVSKQIIVVNPDSEVGSEMVYLNPKILKRKGRCLAEEGCLSFPGIYGNVTRALWIEVSALLLNGETSIFTAEDFAARVIQHEIDHLHGITFIQKFQPAEKITLTKSLRELEESYV